MKNLTRVMAGLVCGAIVAGSSSVAAFADEYNNEFPIVTVQSENGTIECIGGTSGKTAAAGETVYVQLIPDAGYTVCPQFDANLWIDVPFTTNTYANQDIKLVDAKNHIYTFVMPSSPEVEISAKFAPAK